ncbi:MAG TPA: M57 family metalloprotease [Thermoanaerobaculia bacterium]|nr:M57 family metalloprotease [Thermoanaerobaculia bacterium]
MRITSPRLALLTLALLLPVTAAAEYYILPEDREMLRDADAIAIVKVTGIHSAFAGEREIVMNIDVQPELVLKGSIDPAATLRVVEPGGIVGTQIMLVSAAPGYWMDNRALVFLHRTDAGEWRTYGAALGKFDFVRDAAGRQLAVRWTAEHGATPFWTPEGQPKEDRVRDAQLFIRFIQRLFSPDQVIDRRQLIRFTDTKTEPEADYFVENPSPAVSSPHAWDPAANATFPPSAYTLGTFRWEVFDDGGSVSFRISGTQPGYDSVGAAQRALAAWTNDTGSNVRYTYAGTSTAGFDSDDQNTIVYNNSTDVPAGAIAYARWYGGSTHTYKGESFYSIVEGDVVVKSNLTVSAKVFDEAVTHELGHTLGFRHSDQGTPSSTQAVMKTSLSGNYGATLGPWDIEAVRTVYEETVTTAPLGVPSNLVATATSTSSIGIAWSPAANATGYQLERSSNNSAFALIASPSGTSYVDTGRAAGTTYVYRVRATGGIGSVPSAYSNRDHATTIIFVDDPIVPRVTQIKATHLVQLRQAVNAVRAAAGLAAESWTNASPTGVVIRAVHITELREALTPALTILGKTATYTDPSLSPGTPVKAIHFQEIRNLVK